MPELSGRRPLSSRVRASINPPPKEPPEESKDLSEEVSEGRVDAAAATETKA